MFIDDAARLRHMLDAADKPAVNVAGRTKADLAPDENLGIVLAHWVQIMGEAARLISADLKDRHPEVEWSKIQGMRHRIVHDYDAIDLGIVSTIATICAPS